MKVLHVLNEFPHFGNGIVNVTVDLACRQSDEGHAVAVASAGGSFTDLVQQHGVEHFQLDQTRRPLALARAAMTFRRVVETFRPDVVHAHMMTGAVLSRALRGRAAYGLVTTVHNEYQPSALLMGVGDRVVAVSNAVAVAMRRRGVPARRLRVVHNGTIGSPRRLPDGQGPLVGLARPAVVSVNHVCHRKGSDVLVRAFSEVSDGHPDAHLYLVGNRDWPELEAQSASLPGIERVHFVGYSEQPQTYLRESDVFVLASRREPYGLVLAEAREAGTAIVASDVDGIPEALDGGRAGRLVPPGDMRALATALDDLLSSPALRAELASAGQVGLEQLSVQRMHEQYLEVYEEVAGRQTTRRLVPR